MLANLGVLVGAGFTTTSSAMAWLLYALAKYPDCQDKMLQELVDNDITKDTEFTPAVLEKLTYLEKFLKETLRMHGPSFAPGRTAQVDNVVLPGGYVLNKGDVVISALYSIHYHPKIWNNPERFDPERWTPALSRRDTSTCLSLQEADLASDSRSHCRNFDCSWLRLSDTTTSAKWATNLSSTIQSSSSSDQPTSISEPREGPNELVGCSSRSSTDW